MAHRYFTEDIWGDRARLAGEDARHLAKVLRVGAGETLVLCDGRGTDYDAVVESADAGEVLLRLSGRRPSTAEPGLWAEVYIGYAKGERMDYAIQKSVELGASVILPFFSEHTVVKPKKEEDKNRRFARIAAEAAKQCGRGILPRVELPLGFEDMLQRALQNEKALFFYEAGGAALRRVLGQEKSIALITGPEGGFSRREAEQAKAAGCVTVGLGPRILRCESAPAAALAVVMACSGNLE